MTEREPGGHNNATKHGAFAHDIILEDEDGEEFERLHERQIADWNPVGATEEFAVYILAQCVWVNARVERYYAHEMKLTQTQRIQCEHDALVSLHEKLKATRDELVANRIIGLLPERYSKWTTHEFPRSKYPDARSWIEALLSSAMPKILEINATAAVIEREGLQYQMDQAARVRELMDKKAKLDERLDLRTDKAIRRLIQLKALRQVVNSQPSQTKSIEHADASTQSV